MIYFSVCPIRDILLSLLVFIQCFTRKFHRCAQTLSIVKYEKKYVPVYISLPFIYLFGALRCFQHCTGHITTCSWKGRGNQYIQFIRVMYCKLPTNGKQLPAFPLKAMPGTEPRSQRWEARVLSLCHCAPLPFKVGNKTKVNNVTLA